MSNAISEHQIKWRETLYWAVSLRRNGGKLAEIPLAWTAREAACHPGNRGLRGLVEVSVEQGG